MPDAATCPDCGSHLPALSPEGLCPRCLLRRGLAGETPASFDLTSAFDGPGDVLATLAASVGSVPRVLLRDTDGGPEPPLIRPGIAAGDGGSLRYRIDGEIARGGMGAVLRGRDPDLGRDVAVKVLREDFRGDVDMVRRFVEEAQIGGQLQHPGVVPIYELGILADRRPFFAMKLVKGQTLATLLEARTGPTADLPRFLGVVEAVAQTVAYAHARGVIHRDLKPSNVMVGSFGEVQVMDWGLAKVLPRGGVADDAEAGKVHRDETVIATARSGSDDTDLSRAGSVLGTPSYMAPEQARGEVGRVDERADVFALGSILCEVLTGQPAFTGRSSGEIQRKAALGDTADALARLEACGAGAELVTLAKGCLARESEDRPRSAGEVAGRVTAYLAGVQEKLRRAELERVEERARRRLTTVAAAAVILLGLAGGGAYAWDRRQRDERAAKTTRVVDEALADAERLRGEALAAPAGEAARWAEALSAARRAEGLLAQGEPDAPLRARVAGLRARLEAEQAAAAEKARRLAADRALLADLDSVRGGWAEHGNFKRADADYAAAFRKAGLDLDAEEPAAAGKWLAARSEPMELAGYLDDWSYCRISAKRPEAVWRRLVDSARALDPDPWRDALRSRSGTKDEAAAAEFRRLADDAKALDVQPAPSLILLARQLKDALDDRERAARVLRLAALRDPADFWAHYELSRVHGDRSGYFPSTYPRPDESERHLTAAVALRPHSLMARDALTGVLTVQGKIDEVRKMLRETGRVEERRNAKKHLRWRELFYEGKTEEAVAVLREAIGLHPDDAYLHFILGQNLSALRRPPEALAAFREAARLDPESAMYRNNVGLALQSMGKPDEALAEYRKALRIQPRWAWIHTNVAFVLMDQGRLDEALAAFREAARLNPEHSVAYVGEGRVLRKLGDYAGSLAAFRKADETAKLLPLMRSSWEKDLMQAQRIADLVARMPALLKGDDRPKDNDERLPLAQLCYDTRHFGPALRYWSDAVAADPKLGDDRVVQHRYNAACSAALAAAGQGVDEPKPDEPARAEFRARAMGCLRSELDAWTKHLGSGQPGAGASAVFHLRHWQKDSDLANVRDADALAKLPEAEREDWQALWADVDALLKKAEPVPK